MSGDPRDWADRPYVRVYQSVRDEDFAAVYDDDRALAAWLRLLLEADHVYPARASLPAGLSRHARDVLVKEGVLRITGRTYTLAGLTKERTARAMTGAERQALWRSRHRNAPVTERDVTNVTDDVTPRGRAGASSSYSDVTSLTEGGAGGNPTPLQQAVAYIEDRTRRPWSFTPGSKVWETLEPDVRDFGWPAVKAAMDAEKVAFPDVAQLVFGASRRLHPISRVEADDSATDPAWIRQKLSERKAKVAR